jgi:DNA primase small subunit
LRIVLRIQRAIEICKKWNEYPMSREEELVTKWFREYYAKSPPPLPPRHLERELAFMYYGKDFMQRHMAFTEQATFNRFLSSRVPTHVYYSTALYQTPSASTMDAKVWKGADLIFDLDADHIPGSEGLTYEEMLARVKKEMVRLLDDFLLDDLGFTEDDLEVTFSGGRGYHAHIYSEKVLGLKSHERSEIVDYVAGTDLDFSWLFPEKIMMVTTFKNGQRRDKGTAFPVDSSGGWKRRMNRGTRRLLDEFKNMSAVDAKVCYRSFANVDEKLIGLLKRELFDVKKDLTGAELMFRDGSFEYIDDRVKKLLIGWLTDEVPPRSMVEVDQPVTRDIKRLIRLPYSLHGKTGLRVISMKRDELTDFDPLRDAFPDVFPDAPMKIKLGKRLDIKLKGERFSGEGEIEVPTWAGIFLVLRKYGTLP